jgi:hypothetical protein
MARRPKPAPLPSIENIERAEGIANIGKKRYLVDFTSGQLAKDLYGETWHKQLDGIITVDSSLRGKEFFDTVVHELLHGYFDESGLLTRAAHKRREELITELANQISDVIFTPDCLRRCGF